MAKFTKRAIVETFLDLLAKKPLSQITVKEITDICEINHNTFYYYFSDIYAIVDELFNDELQRLYEVTFTTGTLGDACSYALDFTLKNKKSIRNIYDSVSRDQLQNYLLNVIDKVVNDFADRIFKDADVPPDDRKLLISYHKYALFGGMLSWLSSGKDDELEYVLGRFSAFTEESLSAYMHNALKSLPPTPARKA